MSGKQKCKMLREIRQRIADENDIPYVTHECPHQGECMGTCPRCESELRYLEQQLARRASMGKRVAVAALCTGMMLTASGCAPLDRIFNDRGMGALSGQMVYVEPKSTPEPEQIELMGEMSYVVEEEIDG